MKNRNIHNHKIIFCMCFESKAKVVEKIKKKIRLPKNWMAKTEDTVLITYFLDGVMMFLTLDRSTVAELLKQFGLIKRYEGSGPTLKMYGCSTPKGDEAGFSSDWSETQVVCSDIKVFESDAIHLIACEEYEKIVELMCGTRTIRRSMGIQYNTAIQTA